MVTSVGVHKDLDCQVPTTLEILSYNYSGWDQQENVRKLNSLEKCCQRPQLLFEPSRPIWRVSRIFSIVLCSVRNWHHLRTKTLYSTHYAPQCEW